MCECPNTCTSGRICWICTSSSLQPMFLAISGTSGGSGISVRGRKWEAVMTMSLLELGRRYWLMDFSFMRSIQLHTDSSAMGQLQKELNLSRPGCGSFSSKAQLYQLRRGTMKTPVATSAGPVSTPMTSSSLRSATSLHTESGKRPASASVIHRSWLPGTKNTRLNLAWRMRKPVLSASKVSPILPATMRMSFMKAVEDSSWHHCRLSVRSTCRFDTQKIRMCSRESMQCML
mmetsp:Transcript_21586/g.47384  ORF Transcript_21586/g.47384 Transcript_21586/m.47384 type:complete len:232 (-) Transcript_21586:3597-4292(-)